MKNCVATIFRLFVMRSFSYLQEMMTYIRTCLWILFILAGIEDMDKSLHEFEFRPDLTFDYGLSCTCASKKSVSSFSKLQVMRRCIISWICFNFRQSLPPIMELAALEGHKKNLHLQSGKQSYHFLACLIFDPFNTCRSLCLQVTRTCKTIEMFEYLRD